MHLPRTTQRLLASLALVVVTFAALAAPLRVRPRPLLILVVGICPLAEHARFSGALAALRACRFVVSSIQEASMALPSQHTTLVSRARGATSAARASRVRRQVCMDSADSNIGLRRCRLEQR